MIAQPVQEQLNLEHLKTRIIHSEGELKRLADLCTAEEYAVGEAIKTLKFHEEEIEKAKAEKQKIDKSITDLKIAHEAAIKMLEKADEIKLAIKKETEAVEQARISHTALVNVHATQFKDDQAALLTSKEAHIKREGILNERENKLREREARIMMLAKELQV